MKTTYLGDGVYLQEGENGIWIYTFDGYEKKNYIFFEHDTLNAFKLWMQSQENRDG